MDKVLELKSKSKLCDCIVLTVLAPELLVKYIDAAKCKKLSSYG
jgi:hypothetical protein